MMKLIAHSLNACWVIQNSHSLLVRKTFQNLSGFCLGGIEILHHLKGGVLTKTETLP